jgi:hypothetical protein
MPTPSAFWERRAALLVHYSGTIEIIDVADGCPEEDFELVREFAENSEHIRTSMVSFCSMMQQHTRPRSFYTGLQGPRGEKHVIGGARVIWSSADLTSPVRTQPSVSDVR